MDWNPYSDLPWGIQYCYQRNYFSEYDRFVWILDGLAYGDPSNSLNSLTLKEWKRNDDDLDYISYNQAWDKFHDTLGNRPPDWYKKNISLK